MAPGPTDPAGAASSSASRQTASRSRAPQFPLSSLADDVARLRQVLEFQDGPTIVVGHSYGGQIITALGPDAPNVVGARLHRRVRPRRGRVARRASLAGAGHAGARASLHRRARLRLALGGRLRQPLRRRRRSDTRARVMYAVQQPLASSAFTDVMGAAGVEVAAVAGTSSPRTTRRSRPTPSASSRRGWARPPSRSRRATSRWSPTLPRSHS